MLVVDLYGAFNTVTNWATVAAGVDGVYLKYTDGTGRARTRADAYAASCAAEGIPYGGYCYAEPGDPVAQADALTAEYGRLGGTLAPALDIETNAIPVADRITFAQTFLRRLHEHFPVATLYASTSWLSLLRPDTWGYPWLRTWVAEYGTNNGHLQPLTYRGTVHLHQYTSVGVLSGVAGNVDLSHADSVAPLLLTTSAPKAPNLDEEEQMQPLRLAPSPNTTDLVIIWDGRPAVLNVIAEAPAADDYIAKALCWGPAGGTGGGTPTNSSVPQVPGGWRVTANQPVSLIIPQGTTRIVFSYSCGGYTQIQVVPT